MRSETVYIVVNDSGTVRSTGGYRYEPFGELGLHDLITNFAFPEEEHAEEKAEYVNSFEKYAPGEKANSIATDRKERMGKRAKQGFEVKEIEINYDFS